MRSIVDNGEEIARDQIMAGFDVLDSERRVRLAEEAERLMAEQQVFSGAVQPIQCPRHGAPTSSDTLAGPWWRTRSIAARDTASS